MRNVREPKPFQFQRELSRGKFNRQMRWLLVYQIFSEPVWKRFPVVRR
jgi:hypothetical protein